MTNEHAEPTLDGGLFPRAVVAGPQPIADSCKDIMVDELVPVGAMRDASNATVLALALQADRSAFLVVYKPVQGTRPLWDFPAQTLSARECLCFQLSQVIGADLVPPTFWVDGTLGPGSVQLWIGSRGFPVRVLADDLDQVTAGDLSCLDRAPERGLDHLQQLYSAGADLVDVVDSVPAEWHSVLQLDSDDDEVLHIAHADAQRLRQLALFDVVTNNADRKIGHIVGSTDRLFGIDNGLTFHSESKLRTVLWGFAGQQLEPAEIDLVQSIPAALADCEHVEYLTAAEIDAVSQRVEDLCSSLAFPRPIPGRPNVPWPPW